MKRYEYLLNQGIEYPADVAKLKEACPELAELKDGEVQMLYREYSDMYCAGWLILDDRVDEFVQWVTAEVDEQGF